MIAMAPLQMPSGIDDPQPVKEQFELLIQTKLTKAGFSVMPPQCYNEIWTAFVKEAGGLFDPMTGKIDEAKVKSVEERTAGTLRDQHHADGILYSVAMHDGMGQRSPSRLETMMLMTDFSTAGWLECSLASDHSAARRAHFLWASAL